jgi:hypothetical protein
MKEPVKGNWEGIVSFVDFIKLQNLLKASPSGYQLNKEEAMRPLTRT